MSGMSARSEAAAPKARDFAHEARHEKHDTTTTTANKENLGVWRKLKAMVQIGI